MKLTAPLIALDAFIMRRITAPIAGKLDYLFGWSQFRIARGLVYVSLILDAIWSALLSFPVHWFSLAYPFAMSIWVVTCMVKLSALQRDEARHPETLQWMSAMFWPFRLFVLASFILLDWIGYIVSPWPYGYLHVWAIIFGMVDYFAQLPVPPEKRERFDWSFGFRRPVLT